MTNEEDISVQQRLVEIADAIKGNSNWVGRTNRETRDKIELGAQQIECLTKQIAASTEQTGEKLVALTKAINTHAQSNTRVSRWMVILTLALAVATAITAIAAVLQLKSHRDSTQSVGAYSEKAADGLPGNAQE